HATVASRLLSSLLSHCNLPLSDFACPHRPPPRPSLFPYTTLFRSPHPLRLQVAGDPGERLGLAAGQRVHSLARLAREGVDGEAGDRKSTRLNSSHGSISYAVFCLKKKRRV